jgi:hypothetical protein
MSHYITVPINENGIIFDTDMVAVVQEAIAVTPFGFDDVYVYSHGWSTDAYRALDLYNRFSVDLAKLLLLTGGTGVYAAPPRDALGVGIHWPSEITEDPGSDLNALQLFTFYTMEHRADAVGKNAVYSMLRLMLAARAGTGRPLRFFLLGHSFGCKVICSALQDLYVDITNGTIPLDPATTFHAALIEPATDNDNLEPGDIYGGVSKLPLRMLVTKSSLDRALGTWYPLAGKLANLFGTPRAALGASGPTAAIITAFGGADAVSVAHGFTATGLAGAAHRLVVADLSPVHQYRVTNGIYTTGGSSGSHSDFLFAEVYQLISGFLFGLA